MIQARRFIPPRYNKLSASNPAHVTCQMELIELMNDFSLVIPRSHVFHSQLVADSVKLSPIRSYCAKTDCKTGEAAFALGKTITRNSAEIQQFCRGTKRGKGITQFHKIQYFQSLKSKNGGEEGIRTLETVTRLRP